jgi:hypothetical protein
VKEEISIGKSMGRVAAFAVTLIYLLFWNYAAIAVTYSSALKTAGFLAVEALMLWVVYLSCGKLVAAIALYLVFIALYLEILSNFEFLFWINETARDLSGLMYFFSPFGVGVLLLAMNRGVWWMTEPRLNRVEQAHD